MVLITKTCFATYLKIGKLSIKFPSRHKNRRYQGCTLKMAILKRAITK